MGKTLVWSLLLLGYFCLSAGAIDAFCDQVGPKNQAPIYGTSSTRQPSSTPQSSAVIAQAPSASPMPSRSPSSDPQKSPVVRESSWHLTASSPEFLKDTVALVGPQVEGLVQFYQVVSPVVIQRAQQAQKLFQQGSVLAKAGAIDGQEIGMKVLQEEALIAVPVREDAAESAGRAVGRALAAVGKIAWKACRLAIEELVAVTQATYRMSRAMIDGNYRGLASIDPGASQSTREGSKGAAAVGYIAVVGNGHFLVHSARLAAKFFSGFWLGIKAEAGWNEKKPDQQTGALANVPKESSFPQIQPSAIPSTAPEKSWMSHFQEKIPQVKLQRSLSSFKDSVQSLLKGWKK